MARSYGKKIHFEGNVVKRIHENGDYKIYAMCVNNKRYPDVQKGDYGTVTILGDMPTLSVGIKYEIDAVEAPGDRGMAYKVNTIRRYSKMSKEGLRMFLEEFMSVDRAKILSDAYPDIIDMVRENRTDDIDVGKLHGIGEKTLDKAIEKIVDNFHIADLVDRFNGSFTHGQMKKLYDRYGSADMIEEKLKQDAYRALTSVSGIGFKTADPIVMALQDNGVLDFGCDIRSSVQRCVSCVRYCLDELEGDGDTRIGYTELRDKVDKYAHSCLDKLDEALDNDMFYYNERNGDVALRSTFDKERYIAKILVDAIEDYKNVWTCDVEKYRSVGEFELSDQQMKLLNVVCNNQVSILNGSAGSGKSFSTQALIKMLDDMDKTYIILSPTGKASKVISEYTDREAATIHRGLGYRLENGRPVWTYNHDNRLSTDIVIVDEMSMVDVDTFYHLVDAIDFKTTKLLMIGDSAQLASVGCGNLLHDFLGSGIIPCVTLTKIFRYGDGGILTAATDMRNGKKYLTRDMKNTVTAFGDNKDYIFIDIKPDKIVMKVASVYDKLLSGGLNVNDIQVIAPKKVGKFGTDVLNPILQRVSNKNYGSDRCYECGSDNGKKCYYVGDSVIQMSNNYKAPISESSLSVDEVQYYSEHREEWPTAFIANGDSGIITDLDKDFIEIDFDGVIVKYDKKMINTISLGYAITAHKSQGSGFDNVIFLSPKSDVFMLNSNLMYVGCTRAKKKCFHIGEVDAVNIAVTKKENANRKTFMQQMLKGFLTLKNR